MNWKKRYRAIVKDSGILNFPFKKDIDAIEALIEEEIEKAVKEKENEIFKDLKKAGFNTIEE